MRSSQRERNKDWRPAYGFNIYTALLVVVTKVNRGKQVGPRLIPLAIPLF
jgi:hypothetical protein